MAEAEVSLRLAFWLVRTNRATGDVQVAIDGAQVKTGSTIHFEPVPLLQSEGWTATGRQGGWRGRFQHPSHPAQIEIHSRPGLGDVVAPLADDQVLRAECKKGPLERSRSSAEYPLLREALGQLLTVGEVAPSDVLAVAVPHSAKFCELAQRWREAPLIERFGIRILTVDPNGEVHGFGSAAAG